MIRELSVRTADPYNFSLTNFPSHSQTLIRPKFWLGVHFSLCGGFEGWAADERAAGAGAKIFVQASIFTEAGRAKL